MKTAISIRHQQGSTILEALVAILIFSIGVLSVVALQAVMMRDASASKYRADAAFLSSELIGRMWGDTGNLAKYDTTSGGTYQPRTDWVNKVAANLVNGSATVAITSTTTGAVIKSDVTITVLWTPPSDVQHKFVTATSLIQQ